MSYGPPVGGYPAPGGFPAPQRPANRPRAAALPGLAVLLILDLLMQFSILAFDLNRAGADYLPTALGINFDHYVEGVPIAFLSGSTSTCLLLIALIIGAFAGGGWVRAGGAVLLLANAYPAAMGAISQLTGSDTSREAFHTPVAPNLLLNLEQIGEIVIAVIFALVVLATRRDASAPAAVGAPMAAPTGYPAPQPNPGYAPPNPAPNPAPIPPRIPQQPGYAAPPPPPNQPPSQPQPPAYGYPAPPQDRPPVA